MSKKIKILITVLVIVVAALLGWYFLSRNLGITAGEVVRNILPFGSGDGTSQPTRPSDKSGRTTDSQQPTDELGRPTEKLFRISMDPIAGAVVLNKGTSTVIVRYVDRATGHIYDADLATLAKTKVTNQTLPKIYEAYFRPDGNAVLIRFLKDDSDVIENFSLTLTPPKATSTLYSISSNPLRGNIDAVAVGPANLLFYVLRDNSTIVSSAFNGTGVKTLFTSSFNNWRLNTSGNNLVVSTKASAGAPGYAYTLSTSSGTLRKLLGPLSGLVVTVNSLGNRVLYSYVDGNQIKLFAKNLQDNTLSEILPATIAEKCVWSTKKIDIIICATPKDGLLGEELDGWYRGITHFSDRIWLFDTNTDIAQVLVEPKQSLDVDIDISELKLSSNEDYLVFTNKIDLSLWALRLE